MLGRDPNQYLTSKSTFFLKLSYTIRKLALISYFLSIFDFKNIHIKLLHFKNYFFSQCYRILGTTLKLYENTKYRRESIKFIGSPIHEV